MAVVISDTSPINHLVLIGEIDVLPRLYGKVIIPDVVLSELRDTGSPAAVASWAVMLPTWTEVVLVHGRGNASSTLDPGELAAVTYAESAGADTLLLLDDAAGRSEAARLGLRSTGTLGVIRVAHEKGLLELESALDKLSKTNLLSKTEVAGATLLKSGSVGLFKPLSGVVSLRLSTVLGPLCRRYWGSSRSFRRSGRKQGRLGG